MELWEVMKEMNENMDKRFQEWNSQVGGDRKLVEKEGGESKGKSEERSQETAGGQEQRTGKNVAMTQQRVRNADKAVNQRVVIRVQNQRRGDCAWEKGNDFQCRPKVFNQVYANSNEYFLRNRLVNKT